MQFTASACDPFSGGSIRGKAIGRSPATAASTSVPSITSPARRVGAVRMQRYGRPRGTPSTYNNSSPPMASSGVSAVAVTQKPPFGKRRPRSLSATGRMKAQSPVRTHCSGAGVLPSSPLMAM